MYVPGTKLKTYLKQVFYVISNNVLYTYDNTIRFFWVII